MKKGRIFILSIILFIFLYIGISYLRIIRSGTLEGWVSIVQESEYELIYSTETDFYYYAVFDAGNDKLAFYRKSIDEKYESPQIESVKTLDMEDKDVGDMNNVSKPIMGRLFHIYTYIQGEKIPIRKDYSGKIRIMHQVKFIPLKQKKTGMFTSISYPQGPITFENMETIAEFEIPWHSAENND